jgi:hypothetical protein
MKKEKEGSTFKEDQSADHCSTPRWPQTRIPLEGCQQALTIIQLSLVAKAKRSSQHECVKCVLQKNSIGETRNICNFYSVAFHMDLCFEKYHSKKHY